MTETRNRTQILLVDDEALVREELGGLLEDEGYSVATAPDGQAGLDLVRTLQPQMVITDVRMPKVDGLTLVRILRQDFPGIPVTVITGHGTETMAIDALRAGVVDFIKKPVRLDDLTAALERMRSALHTMTDAPTKLPKAATLLEQQWVYQLGNARSEIPAFVDALLAICATNIARGPFMELSLATRELVTNAVEHGNLGLTYAEKTAALENGSYEQLLAGRAAREPFCGRTVTVLVRRTSDEMAIEIRDEGGGFNWRALPDPTDPANLLADHGRGVLLAQISADQVSYNERGNIVTLLKRIH